MTAKSGMALCDDRPMPEAEPLGAAFARALTAKDFDGVAALLHPDVDFRGMTPNRIWEARSPDAVVADVLRLWLEDSDEVEELVKVELGAVGDRQHVGYRFVGTNPDGPFVVEQQAYLEERDGRIGWMRVLCSGFQPR
jgi:SnoaL-like domain